MYTHPHICAPAFDSKILVKRCALYVGDYGTNFVSGAKWPKRKLHQSGMHCCAQCTRVVSFSMDQSESRDATRFCWCSLSQDQPPSQNYLFWMSYCNSCANIRKYHTSWCCVALERENILCTNEGTTHLASSETVMFNQTCRKTITVIMLGVFEWRCLCRKQNVNSQTSIQETFNLSLFFEGDGLWTWSPRQFQACLVRDLAFLWLEVLCVCDVMTQARCCCALFWREKIRQKKSMFFVSTFRISLNQRELW